MPHRWDYEPLIEPKILINYQASNQYQFPIPNSHRLWEKTNLNAVFPVHPHCPNAINRAGRSWSFGLTYNTSLPLLFADLPTWSRRRYLASHSGCCGWTTGCHQTERKSIVSRRGYQRDSQLLYRLARRAKHPRAPSAKLLQSTWHTMVDRLEKATSDNGLTLSPQISTTVSKQRWTSSTVTSRRRRLKPRERGQPAVVNDGRVRKELGGAYLRQPRARPIPRESRRASQGQAPQAWQGPRRTR